MVSSPETDIFTCGGRAPLFRAMDEAVVHGEVDGWRDWELLARGKYLSGQRRMLHLLRIFTMPGSAQGIRQLLCVTPQWGDGGGTFTHPRRLGTDYGESKRWEWGERVAAVGPCQMLVAVDFRASNHPAWLSGCRRAELHPFMAQQRLCGCTWTMEKEGAFPEQKVGD